MSERYETSNENAVSSDFMPTVTTDASMFQYDSLQERAQRDFTDFREWTASNPDRVAEHFELYEQYITDIKNDAKLSSRIAHVFGKQPVHDGKQEYPDYFGVTNLGQLPSEALRTIMESWRESPVGSADIASMRVSSAEDAVRYISRYVPGVPEDVVIQSGERLHKLHHILPEFVIRDGGMEKVLRIMMGVIALAAAETAEATEVERNNHITQAVPLAYAYGATYPIVDDILHDSEYASDKKDRYHTAILKGLSKGENISEDELEDHPIAEEMRNLYNDIRSRFPFDEHRDLYYALESMYLAQHHDAKKTVSDITNETDFYVPIILKASLSRIVAHQLAGNKIGDERSAVLLQSLLRQQFCDDQRDVVEDLKAERITPFTLHVTHPELGFGNPFFYRIAKEAYIAHQVYSHEDQDRVRRALSLFGARDIAYSLSTDQEHTATMQEYFSDDGGPVDQLIRVASGLGKRGLAYSQFFTPDKYIAKSLNDMVPERDPQLVDPRTYISDALSYLNTLFLEEVSGDSPVEEVMHYALESGGKRVRPALTLMLAESLGISRELIEPLLISSEFAHTASLIFDDLPAQDNATLRRGRKATHIKFPEYDAQLAGISMIGQSVSVLGKLGKHFPPDKVNEVVEYTGSILGAEKLCLGQHMDLTPSKLNTHEDIIEMYNLKTSTMIESALVPLMMLTARPQVEIEAIQQYAYHAGIIFQLRDDILDVTSSAEMTGKNDRQDNGKNNIVNLLGVEAAQSMLDIHLQKAVDSLSRLPFPTKLLQELVTYFATRKK